MEMYPLGGNVQWREAHLIGTVWIGIGQEDLDQTADRSCVRGTVHRGRAIVIDLIDAPTGVHHLFEAFFVRVVGGFVQRSLALELLLLLQGEEVDENNGRERASSAQSSSYVVITSIRVGLVGHQNSDAVLVARERGLV